MSLPIGIQDFATLRRRNKLYVDKTDQLACLADTVERCFLSRPRRFGKSLTLSTLEAMFQGRAELFKGLAAEEWVKEQSDTPTPTLRLDMSGLQTSADVETLGLSIREKLNGFCFDGKTKLYNPFSVLNFFAEARFSEFWYDSGTPSFISAYLKRQAVKSVDEYRHLRVGDDFTSTSEIYAAPPESFLYQAGYLTMEKYEGRIITLDYPNKEVLSAISRTFLDSIYGVEGALLPGMDMLQALHDGDIGACMEQLNSILSGVASELFRDKHESTYSALFTALLRGAGADCESESNSSKGRCDLKVRLRQKIYVIEFKLARQPNSAERLLQEGTEQIHEKGYMEPHAADSREIVPLTVVFDAETHRAVLWR